MGHVPADTMPVHRVRAGPHAAHHAGSHASAGTSRCGHDVDPQDHRQLHSNHDDGNSEKLHELGGCDGHQAQQQPPTNTDGVDVVAAERAISPGLQGRDNVDDVDHVPESRRSVEARIMWCDFACVWICAYIIYGPLNAR